MIPCGQYEDTLRALGRFLEQLGASHVGIIDNDENLEVSWQARDGSRTERRYHRQDLLSLRASARLYRGLEGGSPRLGQAEFLRTLGRLLDEMQAETMGLMETNSGFWLSARVAGEPVGQEYTYGQLVDRACAFHQLRSEQQPMER